MKRARDIMTAEVVTVSPGTTIEELGRLFIRRGVSGVPVVETDGRLFGMVTENDLIRQNKRFHIPTVLKLFDAVIPLEGQKTVEEEIRMMSASKVSEICARDVVTVGPETPLQDIATLMVERGVHHLPVVESGKIVGIIGKIDVIRAVIGETDNQGP